MKSFVFLAFGLSFCFFTSPLYSAAYSGGDGSETNPYQISTITDWQTLMDTSDDWASCFILTSDLDLTGMTLTPVGTSGIHFLGSFNGNGRIIRNAVLTTTSSNAGLFGYVGSSVSLTGEIYNLGVEAAAITGKNCVGVLVGYNLGMIDCCYVTGTTSSTSTTAETDVGGLVGYNEESGVISDCYAMVTVTGTYSTSYVGGLVGYNYYGIISNCYSTGSVSGGSKMGGVLGRNWGYDAANCLWDTETSGLSSGVGRGDTSSILGLDTAGMEQIANFTNAGWDFLGETANGDFDIWRMCTDGENYPQLNFGYAKAGDFVCPGGIDTGDLMIMSEDWLVTYTVTLTGADANGDMSVDMKDFAILASYWLTN